jgi:glycosyltransferase involved in cell wall biosynthesis
MKLTIITINLNNVTGLRKTIESVITQTFKDFEYLIIDGGSTEGSLELIEKYSKYINFFVSEPDSGIYNAMNKGIKQARGEYCLFLNSGDWLYNSDIINRVFSKNYSVDIIYGKSIMYNPDNIEYLNEEPENLTFERFYKHSICHQAMFIKRNLFDSNRYGLYREDLKIVSDWEFNIRAIILGGCSIEHLPFPVVFIDNSGISLTNRELSLNERDLVFKELIPYRVLIDYDTLVKKEEELLKIKTSLWYRVIRRLKML